MPLNAQPVTPIDAGATAPSGLSGLAPASPAQIGASASNLTGTARAGVILSYFVLSIVTGSIVLLLAALIWLNYNVSDDVRRPYASVMNPTKIGSEAYVLGMLESLVGEFQHARDDQKWAMSEAASSNQAALNSFLAKLPSITASQKSTLTACRPLPEGGSRNPALEKCIAVLNDIRQAVVEAAYSTSNSQVAGEAVDKILAHRQALLSFWLQAAQLILLNLLLPLLTALFGYIFGTQQAGQSPQGKS